MLRAFPQAEHDESLWPAIKLAYIPCCMSTGNRNAPRLFTTPSPASSAPALLPQRVHFLAAGGCTEHLAGETLTYRCYYPRAGQRRWIARDAGVDRARYRAGESVRGSASRLAQRGARATRALWPADARAAEPADPGARVAFFRNKAAYIVGKAMNGHRELPFAVPILQNENARSCISIRCCSSSTSCWSCFRLRTPISSSTWRCRRRTSRS